MIKDIVIASIFQRVMAQAFAEVAEDTQIFVIVAVAVYIAGIYRRLNYLLNITNLNYQRLLKTGIKYIKLERRRIVKSLQSKSNEKIQTIKLRRIYRMKDTVKTLTIAIGISFAFIVIAWLAMLAMLLITWIGGII